MDMEKESQNVTMKEKGVTTNRDICWKRVWNKIIPLKVAISAWKTL